MTDEFFPEIDIREDQAETIARGLYVVARADGNVHEREAAMISEFFNSTTDHPSHLGSLERTPPITPANLAAILNTKELRQLFLKTAILLAYVDGAYAAPEAKAIAEFAKACEVDAKSLAQLEHSVRDFMVGQLSHLQNVQAVADVSKSLKG
jgi:tellurite resistance protein